MFDMMARFDRDWLGELGWYGGRGSRYATRLIRTLGRRAGTAGKEYCCGGIDVFLMFDARIGDNERV